MNGILSPSILNSNFLDLRSTIEILNDSEADWIHLDIMDGHFVPNFTFGPPVVAAIASIAQKPLDVHLMIEKPDRCLDEFIDAGASILTVHFEACTHLHRTIQYIKSKGVKAGISINPHTPINMIEQIITEVDLVLNMTVNPGFGGQTFIPFSFEKIKKLKSLILETKAHALIEVDGGVDFDNLTTLKNAGVDAFVVGTALFNSQNLHTTIAAFKERLKNYG